MAITSLVFTSSKRSSRPEVLLGKGALKICSTFTGEHPCRSAISIKLQSSFIEIILRHGLLSNFIEITLRHGCCPVNLLHVFKTTFSKNTFGRLLLWQVISYWECWCYNSIGFAKYENIQLLLKNVKINGNFDLKWVN